MALGCARAALVLGGLVALGATVLAVRLAAGPVAVTSLVHQVAGSQAFSLSRASLGWSSRPAPSLRLILTNPVLRRHDGSIAASAGEARIAILLETLAVGRVRPISLALTHASVALRHSPNGGLRLDDGRPGTAGPNRRFGRLQEVVVQDLTATVTDDAIGASWHAQVAQATAHDIGGAALAGQIDLTLLMADQSTRIIATLHATPGGRIVSAHWTAFDAGRLAIARPYGVPSLPVGGAAQVLLGPDWAPRTVAASLRLGAGRIAAASGSVAIAGGQAMLTADIATHTAHLTQARVTLPTGSDGIAPAVRLAGTAHWGAPTAEAGLAVDIDHIAFADLARYWPAGAAASGRAWMLANAPAGTATGAHLDLTLAADNGDITLTGATGQLQANDLTLAWLSPVPPLTHLSAKLLVISPDALTVEVAHGVQAPSETADPPLLLGPSTFRISGLSTRVQMGMVEATLAGPVAQALALLRENRLHLLARHPIELGTPGGTLAAQVRLSLPLDSRVTIDQIGIKATGQLTALHLGGVVAGRDLDDGAIGLAANAEGMNLNGTARLAGIPATVSVAMDFRAGGPLQAINTYTAQGTASLAQLQAAGLPAGGMAAGSVRYDGRYVERRNGTGQADVHADLREAALSLTALGWQKTVDEDGSAQARVLLDNGRVIGIDGLSITGQGVNVQGRATYAAGQPAVLTLNPVELGATRAAGWVRFPTRREPAVQAELHGSVLDMSPRLKGQPDRPTPSRQQAAAAADQRRSLAGGAKTQRGQPWQADLHFDRVMLGGARALADVTAHAENDGLLVRRAHMTGSAGNGRFLVTLSPQGEGRHLTAEAQDAGGLMAALDLTGAVRGGTLSLDARYDDTLADHPLSGTATVEKLRVVGAVAVAKLLQAMTLYGVVDLLGGPGLGITHLEAPFRFANQVLTLDNARAYSSSLGFTAAGDIDLAAQRADLTGTIVPGYFFNTLPGKLPVLGKLFSPEKGGGVFAATYGLSGPLARPDVKLNPLAALAPGFLRGILAGKPDTQPANPAAAR